MWQEGHRRGEVDDTQARRYRREAHHHDTAVNQIHCQMITIEEEDEYRQAPSLPRSNTVILRLTTPPLRI